MKFKSDRIQDEFASLVSKNPPLRSILVSLQGFCIHEFNEDITITSVFRTEQENKDAHAATSIHCVWGAADVSIHGFSDQSQKRMLDFCNQFTYRGTPGHKVAMIHGVPGGVSHLHIQQPRT